jgi:Cysteine-rich secretory protein family
MRVTLFYGSRLALLAAVAPLLMGSIDPRTNFDQRILAAQNRERAQMTVPPLAWDKQLALGAARWASHLSRSGRFEHSPNSVGEPPQGENIWGGTPRYYLPEDMVALWIAEKGNYRSGVFPANSRSGRVEDVSHYTQLIWRQTRKVGCAVNADGGEEILVCRYSQAGNVEGQSVL